MQEPKSVVDQNRIKHDRAAQWYQSLHPEIYNITEQLRLRASVSAALKCVQTDSATPRACDVGAGRGNLTAHLLASGCHVVAADISSEFLHEIARTLGCHMPARLETILLSGQGLVEIDSESMDMAACYSVLHHVPDYLSLVGEMLRVVKPGGVIYIDHESCDSAWIPSPELVAYREDMARARGRFAKLDRLRGLPVGAWPYYLRRSLAAKWHKLWDRRYTAEGDIHIWRDDHILWKEIIDVVRKDGRAEVLQFEEYLACSSTAFPCDAHEVHQGRCATTALMVARRL